MGVAQLVECYIWDVDVAGSSPVTHTIYSASVQLEWMPPCHGGDRRFESGMRCKLEVWVNWSNQHTANVPVGKPAYEFESHRFRKTINIKTMANIQKTTSTSFPFLAILGLIFITLKLCNIITWSWWWVLAPLWGPFAIVLAVLFICVIIGGFVKVFNR